MSRARKTIIETFIYEFSIVINVKLFVFLHVGEPVWFLSPARIDQLSPVCRLNCIEIKLEVKFVVFVMSDLLVRLAPYGTAAPFLVE